MKERNKVFSIVNLIKDIVTLVLIIFLAIIGLKIYDGLKKNTDILKPVDNHDLTVENNGILGYKVVDFEDAILGASKRQSLLIVDEQDISLVTTTTQSGLFNLGIFSKNQSVTFIGKAQYTIDLSSITSNCISVDNTSRVVTIKVPHAQFHDVVIDYNQTKFSDTEKGLLAFGDIKMSQEQINEITKTAIEKLEEKASENEPLAKADQYGQYVLRDLYEKSISSVNSTYRVKIIFD